MASTQRDVELVIRARDEATKALGTITDALNTLADSQNRTSASAAQTGSTLDKMGIALGNMRTQAQGLDALQAATGKIEAAGAAMERLEQQVTSATERLDGTRGKYEAVGEAIERLRARSNDLKETQASEGAALKQTQLEISSLTAAMTKLGETFPKSDAAAKKLIGSTEAQRNAYRDNLDTMGAYLVKLADLEASEKRQIASKSDLVKESSRVAAELAANSKAYATLGGQIQRQAEIQAQANGRLTEGKEAFGELTAAAERAASALGVTKLSTEGIAAASKSAAETIKQLNAEMAKQPKQVAGPATSAATPRQELIEAKQGVEQAKAVWQQASAAVAALNREIKESAEPTQQQAAQFLLARNAAAEAKAAYDQAAASLVTLRSRLREYIDGTNQERIATVEAARAAREMGVARAALEGSNLYEDQVEELGILARLKIEWQELSAAMRQNFVAQADTIREQKEHTQASNSASTSIENLKSQVLGLAGAYFGLMGAIQAVKGVIDTYRTLEQARAQLVASHNGDQNAAASDMIFLRGQAEHLGLSLKDVAEQYGKLSVAANQNNIAQKTTRELFTSVAESARLVGLDSEKTTNVLYGFVRMIDFGKVSARDFRSVLTMIPGAQKAMDDALDATSGKLGVTRDEFRKLEKSAEGIPVTDALLQAWAENMQKQLGDKLPFALQTFNAEWGRFQTNLQEGENTVGKSGFMDALAFQLQRLNTFMKSDEGVEYFQKIGHALAGLVNAIGFLGSHVGMLKTAFEMLIAVKVGSFVAGLIPIVVNLVTSFRTLTFTIEAFAGGAASAGEVVGAAMGGLPILLGAIAFGMAEMFGSTIEGVTALDKALDEHDRIMTHVQDAYSSTGGKVDEFKAKLAGLTEVQLESGKQDLTKATRDSIKSLSDAMAGFYEHNTNGAGTMGATAEKLNGLNEKFTSGKLTVAQYRDEILKLKMSDSQFGNMELPTKLTDILDKIEKGQAGIKDYDAALKVLHGTSTEAADATTQLNLAFKDIGLSIPNDKLKDFNNSLLDLKKNIPELAKAAEAQAKLEKARETLQTGLAAAGFGSPNADKGKIQAALDAYHQAEGAINAGANFEAAQVTDRGQVASIAKRTSAGGDYVKTANSLTPSDMDALSRVVQAEAGNQGAAGMAAVAQVIVNRLASGGWGQTMSSVVNAPNQFEPVTKSGGSWQNLPKAKEQVLAAIEELFRGIRYDPRLAGALQFQNRSVVAGRVQNGSDHAGTLDFGGQSPVATIGDHSFYNGRAPRGSAAGQQRYASDGAYVNSILAKIDIDHKDSSPESFSKVGEKVSDASKVEPGDIVILKGKGTAAGGLGIFTGRDANGDAEVTSTFGKGKVRTKSVSQDQIAGYRRIPDAEQMFDQQGAAKDQAGEFQQMVKDILGDNAAKTAAVNKSPVDLAVIEVMNRLHKWLDDNKAKAEREGKPFTAGFKPGQEQQVEAGVRSFFDASAAAEQQKKLNELNHQWDEILHGATKVTAEERARQALLAKGFQFDASGKPANAISKEALSTQTTIEHDKDMRQSQGDLTSQGEELVRAKKALKEAYKEGDSDDIKEQSAKVKELSANIKDGLPSVIAYFKAMGDEKVVANLTKLQKELKDSTGTGITDAKELNQWLGDGLVGALNKSMKGVAGFIRGIQGIGGVFRDMRNAFLQFAGDFLLKIAQMILQAEIMKMLNGALGFSPGGGMAGFVNSIVGGGGGASSAGMDEAVVGTFHSGGLVGSSSPSRGVDPALFRAAIRYHTGGIAGLQPDEVPAILRKNEEVLTESSPRHINNIGKSNANSEPRAQDIKIVNAIDSGHMMSEALGTAHGQKAITNFIRSNARSINSALRG